MSALNRKIVVILHHGYMNLYRNKEMGLFAGRMMARGHEVRFIAPAEASEPVIPWGEQFQLVASPGDRRLDPEWVLDYLRPIQDRLLCLWSYMNSKDYRYLIPFSRRQGIPCIVHLDAYRIETARMISRWHPTSRSLARADAVLVQEPEMIDNFASGAVRRRCLVYPASFDADRARSPAVRGGVRRKQVLISGQVYELKRTFLGVEAFLSVLERHESLRDWRLVVAGQCIDADYGARIDARLKASPHGGRVVRTGQLSGDDYYRTLAESRIFLHPSSREGQANVFPEAMHFGLAVLTTHGSKVRYLLDRGTAGVVVPTDDLPAITRSLKSLMEDESRCEALGRLARERQHQYFDFETNFNRLLEFAGISAAERG